MRPQTPHMFLLALLIFLALGQRAFAQASAYGSGGGVIPTLLVLVAMLGTLAFLFRKQLREQFEKDKARRAQIGTTAKGVEELRAQMKGVRLVAIVLAVPTLFLTIVLMIKINNTSSWALQYDTRVQEQLGWWSMGVGLLWILTLAAAALWFVAARNVRGAVADRIAALRARLVEIETELEARAEGSKADLRAEKAILDSELRQLGA